MPPSNQMPPSPIATSSPARDPLTGTFEKVAITHKQAFDIYCELPKLSLRAFAKELNERGIKISYALVGRWSAKYKWQHRRASLKNEGPANVLTIQDRITHLAEMSDRCKQEAVNGLLVQIMETVSHNLGHVEIRTPEDAHSMIDLAQKMVELRDTIEMGSDVDGRHSGRAVTGTYSEYWGVQSEHCRRWSWSRLIAKVDLLDQDLRLPLQSDSSDQLSWVVVVMLIWWKLKCPAVGKS